MEPFSGSANQDVTRWFERFKNFADFRSLSSSGRLQLVKLLCKDIAADYLDSLEDADKNDFNKLQAAFLKRFETPSTLKWKRAADVWTRTQTPTESVETYMAAILNLAKRANIKDQAQTTAAMINGFKPAIKLSVLQRPMEHLQEVMESARIAEAAAIDSGASSDISDLTKTVKDLTVLVKELIVTPQTTTPAVRSVTPPRQVRFDETTQARARSPSPYRQNQQNENFTNFRQERQDRQNDNFTNYRSRRPNEYQPQPSQDWTNETGYPPPPPTGQQWMRSPTPNYFRPTNRYRPPFNPSQPACPNCARRHPRGQCFATGEICRACFRVGHYKRCCRSSGNVLQQ